MTLRTRFTDLVGIEYPILQGGMMWADRFLAASRSTSAGKCFADPTPPSEAPTPGRKLLRYFADRVRVLAPIE